MPIDYSNYPPNWKSEIRPRILKRAGNKCEKCKTPNGLLILRGTYTGRPCYQDMDGNIYDAANSELFAADILGEVDVDGKNRLIKVVLTVAHLDENADTKIEPKDEELAALCQRCHNTLDAPHRAARRKAKREKPQFKLDM